jgi:hypothetical protein
VNTFTDLIAAARDVVSSAMASTDTASLVPTAAIARLRHAAARAATAMTESPRQTEGSLAAVVRSRAGAAPTPQPRPCPSTTPLVSLGQGDYAHGLDASGKPFRNPARLSAAAARLSRAAAIARRPPSPPPLPSVTTPPVVPAAPSAPATAHIDPARA